MATQCSEVRTWQGGEHIQEGEHRLGCDIVDCSDTNEGLDLFGTCPQALPELTQQLFKPLLSRCCSCDPGPRIMYACASLGLCL